MHWKRPKSYISTIREIINVWSEIKADFTKYTIQQGLSQAENNRRKYVKRLVQKIKYIESIILAIREMKNV